MSDAAETFPADAGARLLAGDPSLWTDDPAVQAEIADRLGWVHLPHGLEDGLAQARELAETARADGITHVVLCGMGGSSLAAEVFAEVLGPTEGSPRLTALDTTDPRRIRALDAELHLARTLFIVASKSGSTVETDALRRHYTARLATGGEEPSVHLVAITDPGSDLGAAARAEGWRAVFENPADIGGRFSALSLFGLVPAALLGHDPAVLLQLRHTAEEIDGELVSRATALAESARRGLAIQMLDFPHRPLQAWAEQLVAESTGKASPDGPVGVLPVPEPSPSEAPPDLSAAPPGVGLLTLAALMWDLEALTALTCAPLGINPFDQPDVESAKVATRAVLEDDERRGAPDSAGALDAALGAIAPGGYVALLSYLTPDADVDAGLEALRTELAERTGAPVTIGQGPRYLHSTGQLHKGGPPVGTFVVLEGPDATGEGVDLPVPGRPYTFGRLFQAQAEGDVRALRARALTVVRLRLDDPAVDLARLGERVSGS